MYRHGFDIHFLYIMKYYEKIKAFTFLSIYVALIVFAHYVFAG